MAATDNWQAHCNCGVELETDPEAADAIRIDPADANRIIEARPKTNKGAVYRYDLGKFRQLQDSIPEPKFTPTPATTTPPPAVAPPTPWATKVAAIDPEPPAVAAAATNPHFSEGIEWQMNCTRCVSAMEMRMRGFDVTAAPRPTGDYTQKVFELLFESDGRVLAPPPGGKLAAVGKDDPDGARYWVTIRWKNGGGGHVFAAVRRSGKTYFYEPQNGKELGTKGYAGWVENVRAIRVDDVELGDNVLDLVIPSKGKEQP